MITVHWAVVLYFTMQASMFGLLIGLGAESVDSKRKYVFLWILSFAWPVIVAYKLLCFRSKS